MSCQIVHIWAYIDWVQELSCASPGYHDHRMLGGDLGEYKHSRDPGRKQLLYPRLAKENPKCEDVRIDASSRHTNGHIPF